jgi:hypothetical protein
LQDLAGTIDLSSAATADSLKAYTDFVEKYAGTYDSATGKWSGGLVNETSSQDYITAVAEDGMAIRNALYPSNVALATEYEEYLGSLSLEAPHVQTDYIIPAYDDYVAAKTAYALELPVIFADKDVVSLYADKILAARAALTGQERADSTSTGPFATEVNNYKNLVASKSNYTNWADTLTNGTIDPNGTKYQNLYEQYFADPATAYDPSYQTNKDYNLATKKLREARTTLIYNDKSMSNVLSQFTAEAVQTEMYRNADAYNADGISDTTDIKAAINSWLGRTYSNYGWTLGDVSTFSNVDANGKVISGSTGQATITLTIYNGTTTSSVITMTFDIL